MLPMCAWTGIISILIKKSTWSTQIYGVEIHPYREVLHASEIHLHKMNPSVTVSGTRAKNYA